MPATRSSRATSASSRTSPSSIAQSSPTTHAQSPSNTGFYSYLDREALFERGDVYRIAFDEERAARPPLRLAILGAGGVAQTKYLPALAQIRSRWDPVELVAVSTLDGREAEKMSRIWRVPSYADSARLLADHRPDAVLVTSSDESHPALSLAALEAGAHVLVEKPIARRLDDAAAMCRAAEAAGRVLVTVCNKRYSPAYAEAKRLLRAGEVAAPTLVSAKFTLGYDYVDLLESGTIHVFDLARFLAGDITRVAAIGSPGEAVVTLEFAGGAIGVVATSARALSLHPWERVEVFTGGGWLSVEDGSTLTLHPAEYDPARSWVPVLPNTLSSAEETGGYVGMLEDFLAAARGAASETTNAWDGYRALELVVATRRSLATGEPVGLPLTVL